MTGTNTQNLDNPPELSGDEELDNLNLEIYAFLNGLPAEVKPFAVALSNIYHGAFTLDDQELAQLLVNGGGTLFRYLRIELNGAPVQEDYLRNISQTLFDFSTRGADLVRVKTPPSFGVRVLSGRELTKLIEHLTEQESIDDVLTIPPEKLN
jgi:hypothetical protein